MPKFQICRTIEIDAAHRVPEHGSGCRNLHGHRYKVEAFCVGDLIDTGEQQGMVIDFKFMKEEMMRHIHEPCDHGMILRVDDELLKKLAPDVAVEAEGAITMGGDTYYANTTHWNTGLKLYIMDCVPTAENLARHWFNRLVVPIKHRSEDHATLCKIRVHETPNCFADYPLIGD